MNAKQLQTIDGEKIDAHQCGLCKSIYAHKTPDFAEVCCTCKGCGKHQIRNTLMYGQWCDECWRAEDAKRDLAKIERAKEVQYDGGPVFDGSDYYHDLDTFIDQCEPDDLPEFVFPCTIGHPRLDADSILENMIENLNVSSDLDVDVNGRVEFFAAVEAFNKANENGFQIWDDITSLKVRVRPILAARSDKAGER